MEPKHKINQTQAENKLEISSVGKAHPMEIRRVNNTQADREHVLRFYQEFIKNQNKDDAIYVEGTDAAFWTKLKFETVDNIKPKEPSTGVTQPFNLVDSVAWFVFIPEYDYPVGMMALETSSRHEHMHWYINFVKAAQNKGLGKRCVAFVKDFAEKNIIGKRVQVGADKTKIFKGFYARVIIDNFASLIIHLRAGLTPCELKMSYDMNNKTQPCLFLYSNRTPAFTADPANMLFARAANASYDLLSHKKREQAKEELSSMKKNLH